MPKRWSATAAQRSLRITGLDATTLTLDNGTEFAKYVQMGLPVFFADPGRPHQRSRNENTNGLIRQYVPKGANLAKLSRSKIKRIEEPCWDRRERLWVISAPV